VLFYLGGSHVEVELPLALSPRTAVLVVDDVHSERVAGTVSRQRVRACSRERVHLNNI
jgi:hypothetical protein